ncbi:MAG: hypothetical protein ABI868_22950 [Acidobacteriota bacterium]
MRRLFAATWLIALATPIAAAPPDDLPSRTTVAALGGTWNPAAPAGLPGRPIEITRSVPPQDTRLLIAPTARALKRGEGYVGASQVFVPFFQVGVTDRFSIGAGKPLVFADGFNPVWITPKLQVVARDSVQAAIGVIHMTGMGGGDAGLAYGVTTVGHPDRSATVGVGYGYRGGGRAAIVMLGGEIRTGRNVKLIADSWLWAGGVSFVSGGVRMERRRVSSDFGMVMLIGTAVPVPFVTFAWRF